MLNKLWIFYGNKNVFLTIGCSEFFTGFRSASLWPDLLIPYLSLLMFLVWVFELGLMVLLIFNRLNFYLPVLYSSLLLLTCTLRQYQSQIQTGLNLAVNSVNLDSSPLTTESSHVLCICNHRPSLTQYILLQTVVRIYSSNLYSFMFIIINIIELNEFH